MRKILLSLFVFAFVAANAQNEDSVFIKRISNNILSSNDAYGNLWYLCKKIGSRLAGSTGMIKSEQWGLQTFKKYNPDTAWLQQCMVPHWERGGKDAASITYNGKTVNINVLALGNSVGTGKNGVKAPLLVVNSFEDLEAKKDQIKGKVIFYNIPFGDTLVNPFDSYRKFSGYRSAGPSRAAKYGAVAVLIRSMSHSTDNHPHTGATRYNDSFPKIPAAAVGLRDVEAIAQLNTQGKKLTAFYKSNAKMYDSAVGHNVIAELKGTEFPDEYIIIGGHLDAWDPAEGAHDDGAGVVQTIEVLRAFKALGYQPKHSIRFVLFANEENGLRGGRKYANEAKARKEKHIFALESDAGGFTPRGFGLTVPEATWQKIEQWKNLFLPYGVYDWKKGGGGADIAPLAEALKTPVAGLSPDSQRYFDYHHAANDVFEAVNIRELKLGAVNMAALVYLVDKYGL